MEEGRVSCNIQFVYDCQHFLGSCNAMMLSSEDTLVSSAWIMKFNHKVQYHKRKVGNLVWGDDPNCFGIRCPKQAFLYDRKN